MSLWSPLSARCPLMLLWQRWPQRRGEPGPAGCGTILGRKREETGERPEGGTNRTQQQQQHVQHSNTATTLSPSHAHTQPSSTPVVCGVFFLFAHVLEDTTIGPTHGSTVVLKNSNAWIPDARGIAEPNAEGSERMRQLNRRVAALVSFHGSHPK